MVGVFNGETNWVAFALGAGSLIAVVSNEPMQRIAVVERHEGVPVIMITAHIRDRLLAARDDVEGTILFGIIARGEAWHDIHVLVVLRERIPTRKAWATIVRQCQDPIGLYNLDLIPTHLGGLRQGLAEHLYFRAALHT